MKPPSFSFLVIVLVLSACLSGCTTAPAPSGLDPAVYRPTHRTPYPAPR